MDELKGKNSLTKKESNKLFYSEYLKKANSMWLYELLEIDMPLKTIKIPIEKKTIFSDIIEDLLLNSSDEWIQTKGSNDNLIDDMGVNPKNRKKCSLCNTPNRFIYYIENTLNKKKLNVGSDCINEFGSIANSSKKTLNTMMKNARRDDRKQKLLKRIPDVRTSVEKWDNFIRNLPIMVSDNEIEAYRSLGLKATKIYEKILNTGLKEELIDQLKKIIKDGINEQQIINKRIESISQQDFILTSTQAKWIESNQPENFKNIKKYIKASDDSQVSLICAPLIAEKDFLNTFTQKYNEIAQVNNTEVIELYNEWRRNLIPSEKMRFEQELPNIIHISANKFIYEFKSLKNVHFTLSSSKLLSNLGFLVFPSTKTTLDPSDVLNIVIESDLLDKGSYETFFAQIEYTVNKIEKGNRFNFYKVNLQRDYVDFRVFVESFSDSKGNVEYKYSYRRYTLTQMYEKMRGVLLKRNGSSLLRFLEDKHIGIFTEKQYKIAEREELELAKMNI
ncbi:hypothetical protein [Listeria seeligeri]|uniref:hypothetical protein n=1 Tax=Listeria seeligeri TaxID=1640 RepID=UPI0022EB57C4|nr:hypothetical protein [Listeria seeligeri]